MLMVVFSTLNVALPLIAFITLFMPNKSFLGSNFGQPKLKSIFKLCMLTLLNVVLDDVLRQVVVIAKPAV
jgi:hypothetical protein